MTKVEEPGVIELLRTRSALDLTKHNLDVGLNVDEKSTRCKSDMSNMNIVDVRATEKSPSLILCEYFAKPSKTNAKTSTKNVSSDAGSEVSISSRSPRAKHSSYSKIPVAIKSATASTVHSVHCCCKFGNVSQKNSEIIYQNKVKNLTIAKRKLEEKQDQLFELYNGVKAMKDEIFETTNKEMPIEDIEFKVCQSEKDLLNLDTMNNINDEETKNALHIQVQEMMSNVIETCRILIKESSHIFHEFLTSSDELNADDMKAIFVKGKTELREIENKIMKELRASENVLNTLLAKISWFTKGDDNIEKDYTIELLKQKLVDKEEKLKQIENDLISEQQETLLEKEKYKEYDGKVGELMLKLQHLSTDLSNEQTKINNFKDLEAKSKCTLSKYHDELKELDTEKCKYENKVDELSKQIDDINGQWKIRLTDLYKQNKKLEETLQKRNDYVNELKKSKAGVRIGFVFNMILYFVYDIIISDVRF